MKKATVEKVVDIGAYPKWVEEFQNGKLASPPLSVDINSLIPVELPPVWNTKAAATRAAGDKESFGRYMGNVEINLRGITAKELKTLTNPFKTKRKWYDNDGEFSTPIRGQIAISRIMDIETTMGKAIYSSKKDEDMLFHLYALQSPQTSNWNKPFIRVVSRNVHNMNTQTLKVEYHIYFSRLLFELISDPAIYFIISNIKNVPVERVSVQTIAPQPQMFASTDRELLNQEEFQFSLPGLMKYAESSGYAISPGLQQPNRLKVGMYDYQMSTYQWMLDHENNPRGLNSYFWEEWKYIDGGGSIYYFPLAGEFRLSAPPLSRGGLLCEEMGLGKYHHILISNCHKFNVFKILYIYNYR